MVAVLVFSTRREGLSEPARSTAGSEEVGGSPPFLLPPILFWVSLGTWMLKNDQEQK